MSDWIVILIGCVVVYFIAKGNDVKFIRQRQEIELLKAEIKWIQEQSYLCPECAVDKRRNHQLYGAYYG